MSSVISPGFGGLSWQFLKSFAITYYQPFVIRFTHQNRYRQEAL